jgi:hypothetical protein
MSTTLARGLKRALTNLLAMKKLAKAAEKYWGARLSLIEESR